MKQTNNERQDWQTPGWLLDAACDVFTGHRIGLDPATVASNPTKALAFFDGSDGKDGLEESWLGLGPVFCNPPYGRSIGKWTEQMKYAGSIAGEEVIGLIPARTDTAWWHRDIRTAHGLCFLLGRVRFVNPDTGVEGASGKFPSAVAYWGPNKLIFAEVFGRRGMLV